MNGTSRPRSRTIDERRGAAEARHRVVGDDEIPVARRAPRSAPLRCRRACIRARTRPAAGTRSGVSRRFRSPQPAGVGVVSCSRLPGDPGVRELLRPSRAGPRSPRRPSAFLYLPTRTRKSAVGAPFDGIHDERRIAFGRQLFRQVCRPPAICDTRPPAPQTLDRTDRTPGPRRSSRTDAGWTAPWRRRRRRRGRRRRAGGAGAGCGAWRRLSARRALLVRPAPARPVRRGSREVAGFRFSSGGVSRSRRSA